MKYTLRKQIHIVLFILIFSACSSGPSDKEATALALGESISLTATAAADVAFDSDENLKTAEAKATSNAANKLFTQVAEADISDEQISATATAAAPMLAELSNYGVDPSEGYIAWIHPPETISTDGYLQFDYVNRFIGTVAKNFVISTDITWNTQYGTSGCGFSFRSDGNQEAPNQYLAIATRFGNGRILFSSMVNGELKNAIDHYAYGLDPKFNFENDSTNRLTIVARESSFKIYTNGTFIGEVVAGKAPVLVIPRPPATPAANAANEVVAQFNEELNGYDDIVAQAKQNFERSMAVYQPDTPYFERGFMAMVVLAESGKTICTFENAWLFVMD